MSTRYELESETIKLRHEKVALIERVNALVVERDTALRDLDQSQNARYALHGENVELHLTIAHLKERKAHYKTRYFETMEAWTAMEKRLDIVRAFVTALRQERNEWEQVALATARIVARMRGAA